MSSDSSAVAGSDAKGYYIQPSTITAGNNDCWIIGDQTSASPPFFAAGYDGLPFTPSTSSSAKRAVPDATTGGIGNETGTIGYNGAVDGAPGAGSCDTA